MLISGRRFCWFFSEMAIETQRAEVRKLSLIDSGFGQIFPNSDK